MDIAIVPMMMKLTLLIFMPLLAFGDLNPSKFQADFQKGMTQIDYSLVGNRAADFRWIFVAGIMNEAVFGYFDQNIKELKRLGVPKNQIVVYKSKSNMPIFQASNYLFDWLKQFAEFSDKPLILIGHSKGCAELLAGALQNNRFILEKTKAVILIQGAIGGSPVADLMEKGLTDEDWKTAPEESRMISNAIKAAWAFDSLVGGGIRSLTTAMGKILVDMASKWSGYELSKKIFYVVSHKDPKKMKYPMSTVGQYLQMKFGNSDGALLTKDQFVPGFGTVLMDVDADHTDLTTWGPYTTEPYPIRLALMRAIVMGL